MSGVNLGSRRYARAPRRIRQYVEAGGFTFPPRVSQAVDEVARKGSTPLVVCDGGRVLGVIELKDIVQGGIKERFGELRRMAYRTVMITGDIASPPRRSRPRRAWTISWPRPLPRQLKLIASIRATDGSSP